MGMDIMAWESFGTAIRHTLVGDACEYREREALLYTLCHGVKLEVRFRYENERPDSYR